MTQQLPLPLAGPEAPAPDVRTSEPEDVPPVSREQLRSRRKRDVRARTVSVKRMTKRELELGRLLYPPDEHADIQRPRTRADCMSVPRPCPFVSCKHHLYLDVSAKTGAIKLNFPDLEPWELPEERSCALDVADRGGETLEAVGAIMNLTRERIRQVEVRSLARANAVEETAALREFYGDVDGGRGKRKLPVIQPDDDEDRDDEEDANARDEVDAEAFASPELDDDGRGA